MTKADGTPDYTPGAFVTMTEAISSTGAGGAQSNPQTRSPVNGIVEFETYLDSNAQSLILRVSHCSSICFLFHFDFAKARARMT